MQVKGPPVKLEGEDFLKTGTEQSLGEDNLQKGLSILASLVARRIRLAGRSKGDKGNEAAHFTQGNAMTGRMGERRHKSR